MGSTGQRKNLIVVLADGGWDTSFLFDPKLGSPWVEGPEFDEVAGNPDDRNEIRTYGDLPVLLNPARRPWVGTFFDAWADRCLFVNGLRIGSIAHDLGRTRLLTGTPSEHQPDVATIVGYRNGADLPLGSVDTSGKALVGALGTSAGRLGARSQLGWLLDPSRTPRAPAHLGGTTYPQFAPDPSEQALLDAFLQGRLDALPPERAGVDRHREAMEASRLRAQRLLDQRDVLLAQLQPGQYQGARDLIGLTVGLLGDGICRSITIDSGIYWDTHFANEDQHSCYDEIFTFLHALVSGLDGAGLLDDTVVAVVSEMSRTPLRNKTTGKDHWPITSAMLLGGGVNGGRAIGATDEYVQPMAIDLATGTPWAKGQVLEFPHMAAGLLALLDVDPGEWLPGVTPFLGLGT
jgi:hypothetical protein